MTIHKAKGLEFDTVILPGLGRGVQAQDRALLRWLEHPDYELLLAPIPPIVEYLPDPTYQAIGSILRDKETLESLRLLYVAVTRAKKQLHLLGHLKPGRNSDLEPVKDSLLEMIWPKLAQKFTAQCDENCNDRLLAVRKLTLKRLPFDWSAPNMSQQQLIPEQRVIKASDAGHYKSVATAGQYPEVERVVGVLVHFWLERIAGDGVESWSRKALEDCVKSIGIELSNQGIALNRCSECVDMILMCLTNSLQSEKGQWLLRSHLAASSELALNGLIEGKLVHAVIDRTFIDEQGARWVVDYKTSCPGSGEEIVPFMNREMIRYQGQLQVYSRLFHQFEPHRNVRAALYFPRIDGWLELDLPGW